MRVGLIKNTDSPFYLTLRMQMWYCDSFFTEKGLTQAQSYSLTILLIASGSQDKAVKSESINA